VTVAWRSESTGKSLVFLLACDVVIRPICYSVTLDLSSLISESRVYHDPMPVKLAWPLPLLWQLRLLYSKATCCFRVTGLGIIQVELQLDSVVDLETNQSFWFHSSSFKAKLFSFQSWANSLGIDL
jgi:hypothetical protein